MNPEEIIQKRKDNQERVIKFRHTLESSLYIICEKYTGHDFWDWQDKNWTDVGGDIHYQETRECRLCGFSETRKMEDPDD
jgi:hypothetical protein